MKIYTTFTEIESDLQKLKLERDIAWEELKLMKNEYQEDLKPINWVSSLLKTAGKFGFVALIRKYILR